MNSDFLISLHSQFLINNVFDGFTAHAEVFSQFPTRNYTTFPFSLTYNLHQTWCSDRVTSKLGHYDDQVFLIF